MFQIILTNKTLLRIKYITLDQILWGHRDTRSERRNNDAVISSCKSPLLQSYTDYTGSQAATVDSIGHTQKSVKIDIQDIFEITFCATFKLNDYVSCRYFYFGEKHRYRECLKQKASDNCVNAFQRNQAAGKGPGGAGRSAVSQREERRAHRAAPAQMQPVNPSRQRSCLPFLFLIISAACISCVAAPVELEVLFPKRPFFYTSKVLTPIQGGLALKKKKVNKIIPDFLKNISNITEGYWRIWNTDVSRNYLKVRPCKTSGTSRRTQGPGQMRREGQVSGHLRRDPGGLPTGVVARFHTRLSDRRHMTNIGVQVPFT